MQLFGLTIARSDPRGAAKTLAPVDNRGGWWPVVREAFAGAWQQNVVVDHNAALAFHAVFACITLIASDVSKLRVKLVAQDSNGIWKETTSPAYSPVLRKPNVFQNRIQFFENWVLSKLSRGNTYVLKIRDNRNVVTGLVVLDPTRVTPLVSDSGAVYYQCSNDRLAGLETGVIIPAREIIHDRFNCLFHPLVGLSPIYACGLAAVQGLAIQNNSAKFFTNGARPGGILTAPGRINDETAERLKRDWEANYSGANAGKVAVLGDNLKYEALAATPQEAQMVEQLGWTAGVVCSTFHVPPYKVGLGEWPRGESVQSLNLEYYTQCLQPLIETAELCLDEGLEMPAPFGSEFDIDGLLRMDSVSMISSLKDAVSGGIMAPDEARAKIDLGPTPGGAVPYLQQQNYSLEALAKRDAQADPFASATPKPPVPALPAPAADGAVTEAQMRAAIDETRKGLA